MTPARHTALGVERAGQREVTVAGHRDGVALKTAGGQFVALAPEDVAHLIALLTEQDTNHRLKNEEPRHDVRS